MFIKYKLFLESLDESKKKDLGWFLKQLGAIKLDIYEYIEISREQRELNIDEFIQLKKTNEFVKKYKVKFGEIFDSSEIYVPLDTKLTWIFLLSLDEDQISNPVYVIYKEKNKLIKLAMVTKDDYNVFVPLIKGMDEINERNVKNNDYSVILKTELENILNNFDSASEKEKNNYRKKLIYGFKELIDNKNIKNLSIKLKSGEIAIVNYDDISINDKFGKPKKYSWGELEIPIILEIGNLIIDEL